METPLTVSESHKDSLPKSIVTVINSIQNQFCNPSRNQLISGLFYILMQECGYVLMQPSECNDANAKTKNLEGNEKRMMTFNLSRLLNQAPSLLPFLDSPNGIYKLPLKLVGVEDYKFALLIAPSGDDLVIVTLLITKENSRDCFSITVDVLTFVPKPESKLVSEIFSDLEKLSIIFKNVIAHKGRSAVLNEKGVINNSLVGLMDEIKYKIVKLLPVQDFLNLSVTCQKMLAIKYDKSIWKALIRRDFFWDRCYDDLESVDELIVTYKDLRNKQLRDSKSILQDVLVFQDYSIFENSALHSIFFCNPYIHVRR